MAMSAVNIVSCGRLQWQKLLISSECTLLHSLPVEERGRVRVQVQTKKNKPSILPNPICCRFSRKCNPTYTYANANTNTYSSRGGSNLEGTTSVPVRVAYELLQAGHRYLDVRTPEEFDAAHVTGALNIPYLLRLGSGMTKNPNFLAQVTSLFSKDDEILIGCQSGKRSLMALNDLQSAGYTGIMDVAGGYAAWTQSELPRQS